MKKNLYIDGTNTYTQYGVSVIHSSGGSYRDLICYPPLKSVQSNDWPEEDGIEADLSGPNLDTRRFPLRFICENGKAGFDAFFDLLNNGAHHVFNFPQLERSYNLRLASQPNLDMSGDCRVFSLQFANDFPIDAEYDYLPPVSTYNLPNFNILLDGRNIKSYGIGMTGDYRSEIYRAPEVKKNLTQSMDDLHGVEYDGVMVKYREKEVRLNMLMAAGSLDEFWHNYDAFLYDLVRPGLRILALDTDTFGCYYKSCSASAFNVADAAFFRFTLSLIFTKYRP
jgi:hypothetical protein